MVRIALVGAAVLAGLLVLDRLLLRLEARGWINYRRRGLSGGAAAYHTLEIHSMLEPGMKEVREVKYSEEREEDDSGAPPGSDEGR